MLNKHLCGRVVANIAKAVTLVTVANAVSNCGSGKPPEVTKEVSAREKLELVVEKSREAIPMCDGIAVMNDGSYEGCHSPNGGLHHGLLCFSGEQWACAQMHRFLREDSLVKDPLHPYADHGGSGSRDELVGHLLYLVKTKDTAHAEAVLSLIRRNGNRICTDAVDGRCNMTPSMWGLMRVVWNHLGLKPTSNMLAGNIGDDTALVVAAKTAPLGYQMHLVALEILIRKETGSWSEQCSSALRSLVERWPSNLFFLWLSGQDVSEKLLVEMEKGYRVQRDWSWESVTNVQPMAASHLFLGNLLLTP